MDNNCLVLVCGHTRTSPGAYGVWPINMHEYDFNRLFAQEISHFVKSMGYRCPIVFRDNVGIKGAYQSAAGHNPSAIIELHFNAANGKASGTETLILTRGDSPDIMENEFGHWIQAIMVKTLELPDRGVKNRGLGERGSSNLNQVKDCPSILIEPAFGDNPKDAFVFYEKRMELAQNIARGFVQWVSR